MDDLRLEWIKEVACKYLNVTNVEAFDELFENDATCAKTLYGFLSGSKENRCVFFYDSTIEVEVEVEIEAPRVSINVEETAEDGISLEETSMSADRTDVEVEEKSNIDSEEEEMSDEESRKEFMMQLVTKQVLNICFNITEEVVGRRYVYFILRRFEALPFIEAKEEVSKLMQDYFEFGLINKHPLVNMVEDISMVYLPLLKNQQMALISQSLTECIEEHELVASQNEFIEAMTEFYVHTNMVEQQLHHPFPFTLPYLSPGSTPEQLAIDALFLAEAEDYLKVWIETLSDILEGIMQKKPAERSLFTEILFWEERKTELSGLTDHLSSTLLNVVLKSLKLAGIKAVSVFQNLCENIRTQLFLTNDNLNYLINLEPYLKELHPESELSSAIQMVRPLMNIYKLLWTLSDYYGQAENMGRLIEGLGCVIEAKIFTSANAKSLFDKSYEEVKTVTDSCCELARVWKATYIEQREIIESFEGLQHWYFSTKTLFDNSDYMITVCEDLHMMILEIKHLKGILKPELKMVAMDASEYRELEENINNLPLRLKHVDFNIFLLKHGVLWCNLRQWFDRQCKSIELDAKNLINRILNEDCNLETAMVLIRCLKNADISDSIREIVKEDYEKIICRYMKEVQDIESVFSKHKDQPPQYKGFPDLTSAIIWQNYLLGKIKSSIITFRADVDFLDMECGKTAQENYLRTARKLDAYGHDIFTNWVSQKLDNIPLSLQYSLLKKGEISPYFYANKSMEDEKRFKGTAVANMNYILNFPPELKNIMMFAGFLKYMNFKIPPEIANITSQEKVYSNLVKELNIALFKLHSILGSLSFAEAKLLNEQLETVWTAFKPGMSHLSWASLGVSQFIMNVKQVTDYFGSVVLQVQQIGEEINSKIESLKSAHLLHFKKFHSEDASICQLFFEEAERQMLSVVEGKVKIYHSILPLLFKLESLTCKSHTGKAAVMKEYYRNCELLILNALVEMIIENLDLLSCSLESHIFLYFTSIFKSTDKLVLATTEKAYLTFKAFLTNCVRSTSLFNRWLDGTCIEAAHQFSIAHKEPFAFTYYLDVQQHPEVKRLVSHIDGRVKIFLKTLMTT